MNVDSPWRHAEPGEVVSTGTGAEVTGAAEVVSKAIKVVGPALSRQAANRISHGTAHRMMSR